MRGYVQPPRYEWLAGRRVAKVSPKHRHAVVQLAMGQILRERGRGLGTAGSEWRFALHEASNAPGRTELVPDVGWMSFERWRALSSEEKQKPRCAPDVAVEIRSPGDSTSDLRWKIKTYFEHGCVLVLDVLPEQRSVVAYDAEGGVRQFVLGDVVEHPAVPWLVFTVEEAFSDLDPDE